MDAILFSRYSRQGASSRLRSLQFLPHFDAQTLRIEVEPLFGDEYLNRLYGGHGHSLAFIAKAYWRRLRTLTRLKKFDLIWIERELFPWLPAIFEAGLSAPYVVDYDDAEFHKYDLSPNPIVRSVLGRKIDFIMRQASLVIAGNDYLADRARQAGARRVEVVPTVVDMDRYPPREFASEPHGPITIGWIGSPVTAHYLKTIEPVLRTLNARHETHLTVVGAGNEARLGLPGESRPWSEETEIEEIGKFDIGIMPLADGPWELGKCGYKLIQYMARGVPVVASAVGANRDIIQHGQTGLLASSPEEWLNCLTLLTTDRDLRRALGAAGRKRVQQHFSLQAVAPRLEHLLQAAVMESRPSVTAVRHR